MHSCHYGKLSRISFTQERSNTLGRNHNWFHNVSEPLEPVPLGTINSKPPMSKLQKSRVSFYRTMIRMTRLIGGSVNVAEVPSSEDDAGDSSKTDIGAILLWFPPNVRISALDLLTLYRSGFVALMMPWHYGLTGVYRIELVFEKNIHNMWAKTLPNLPPHGFKEQDCGFVQMIASNPKCAGKRYASELLEHQCRKHFAEYPDRPVILDTTTMQGVRAYERLGFKLLAEVPTNAGTDAKGIRLRSNASEQVKKEATETCIQRVMAKLPGDGI